MATRWSHAHGESYLRRKGSGGGVGDVERLTKELWFRGIGQWCSGLGGICSAVLGVPVAVRAEEGGEMRNGTATRWAGNGVASGRGCDARTSTARGLRAQASGDGWRTRGVKTLSRSATAILKIF